MSEATNTKLMDIEAGGEQTQYEGAQTFTKHHAKTDGASNSDASKQAQEEKSARGEKTAENIRYGEAISEHGFGGETTGNRGEAQQGGYGKLTEAAGLSEGMQTRREQGYGGGSNVGA